MTRDIDPLEGTEMFRIVLITKLQNQMPEEELALSSRLVLYIRAYDPTEAVELAQAIMGEMQDSEIDAIEESDLPISTPEMIVYTE